MSELSSRASPLWFLKACQHVARIRVEGWSVLSSQSSSPEAVVDATLLKGVMLNTSQCKILVAIIIAVIPVTLVNGY